MPTKLPKDFDLSRLCEAMQVGRESLRFFREARKAAVEQAAGKFYSENSSGSPDVPVNIIAQFQSVVGRALIAKAPRVMLSTHDSRQTAAVDAMETWVNEEIVRTNLAGTFARIVTDGLYSVGIAKIALGTPCDAAIKAWGLKGGQPFIDRVDLDDFVFDQYARDWTECAFIGHRYRCPLDVANALYRKGKKEKLTTQLPSDYNAEGDERISVVARGYRPQKGEMYDMVDLWEVYLPRERLIVTLKDDETRGRPMDDEPLYVQPWVGPADGPYLMLGFDLVPGQTMPGSPIQKIMPLHLFVNRSFRKLMRETDALKRTLPVRGGAIEDGQKLKQTSDGEMFECDNADTLKELRTGGPDPVLAQFFQQAYQLADRAAGNLSLLSGAAAQSRTASQDKMLDENSSRMITDLQETAITFTAEALKRLMWFWWYHPQKVMKSAFSPPEVPELSITRKVYPAGQPMPGKQMRRNGPMPTLNVDPYSVIHKTPQSRLAFIDGVVGQMIPLTPILQSQGVAFDANAYLEIQAKYGDEPDLKKVFKYSPPPEEVAGAGKPPELLGGAGGPNGGEYTRTSIGQGSEAAKAAQTQTAMATAASQQQGGQQ
jgi:hypothetical protein